MTLALCSPAVQSAGPIPAPVSAYSTVNKLQMGFGLLIILSVNVGSCQFLKLGVLGKAVCCCGWSMGLGVEAWIVPLLWLRESG